MGGLSSWQRVGAASMCGPRGLAARRFARLHSRFPALRIAKGVACRQGIDPCRTRALSAQEVGPMPQPMKNPLVAIGDAQALAHAIVDTIHEPFLVLDDEFRVLAASRSFYETFKVDPKQTQGCLLYDLG